MAVADIMTTSIVSVSPEETMEVMRKLLKSHKIHHLLVLEQQQLIGIISDRDILRTISPYVGTRVESEKDTFTLTRKAHQIMTSNPVTISPHATIQQAAKCLIDNKVSLLPVVNDKQQAVGVLSWKDVLKFLID